MILVDFNARSSEWWPDDITSPEGTYINSLISMYGFDQLISDPNHILLLHPHVLILFLLINLT